MSADTIIALIGVVVLVLSAVAGVWWRVEAKIVDAKADANMAMALLSAHKLHVAEAYVTKAGMQEQTMQIMAAIHDVGADVRQLNERIDRMIERRPA